MAEVDTPSWANPDQAEQRRLDLNAPGDVKQRAAGPEGGVQGGEDVVRGRDGLGHAGTADQLGMVLHGLVQVEEDRPAQAGRIGVPDGRAVDVLDPGRVVRAQGLPEPVQGGRGPRRPAARGRGARSCPA